MQEEKAEVDGRVEVVVRPLPHRHVVRTVLPKRLFDDRVRHHAERGSKDPSQDAAVWSLVEVGEKFDGRPVIWLERDSVILQPHHDGVELVAIVMFMPRRRVLERDVPDLAAVMRELVEWERTKGQDAMLQQVRQDCQHRYCARDEPVGPGDLVMVEAWNTGLAKGNSVTLTFQLDPAIMPDLTRALTGKVGGDTLVGSYRIVQDGQKARAQKVRLMGRIDTKRDISATEMAEACGCPVESLPSFLHDRMVQNRSKSFTLGVASKLRLDALEPVPAEVASRLAESELRRQFDQFGQHVTLRRLGVQTNEEAVEALIEASVGQALQADIWLYWEAKRLDIVPKDDELAKVAAEPYRTRTEAILMGCRSAVTHHYWRNVTAIQEEAASC